MNKDWIFYPKLISSLRNYSPNKLLKDLIAGLIVAVIAIPLSIAFGIGSGLTPGQGLITAIVAGFIISALGGSRVQIGGPTGAFIVIVYGIVTKYQVAGLLIATLMAGVILIFMGIFRFGSVIKFIPQPIIVGFTAGIAVVIFSQQIKDALGLNIAKMPADFIEKMQSIALSIASVNFYSIGLCAATLALIWLFKKVAPKIPGTFIALVLASLASAVFAFPVATIGKEFGTVALTIQGVSFANITWKTITELIGPAFSIAFLGAIESLLSAVVADAMIGGKHRPNTELIAQGIANLASSLVGGLPATGAIARTAANVRNGARTPVAGMAHAIFLLGIIVFLAPLTAYIPMAVLAGILINVAINMGEWKEFRLIARTSRNDAIALFATFLMTIFVDLVVAIGAGLILASFFFIRNMSEKSSADASITETTQDIDAFYDRPDALSHYQFPDHCSAIELNGAFFFGAATKFEESIRTIYEKSQVLIIRFTALDLIDATGIQVLRRIVEDSHRRKTRIIFTEIPDAVLETLHRSGLLELVGRKNCLPTMIDAIQAASHTSPAKDPA